MFPYASVVLALALSAVATPTPRQSCAAVTVIFARGTTEIGTVGTYVGPYFKSALDSALGSKSLRFVGLDYPADIAGFLAGGSPQGATTMANFVTSTASSCPNTAIVMSGYSQGAQVTHLAAAKLSTATRERVKAIVVFGDPKRGQSFPGVLSNRVKTFCELLDSICYGGILVTAAHLGYGIENSREAASFVVARV